MALNKYRFNPGDKLPAVNIDSIDPDNLVDKVVAKLVGGTNVVLDNFNNRILANITTFNDNGTYTVPAGITKIKILVVAGGGGSGYTGNSGIRAGGGGGGGGVVYRTIEVTPNQQFSVTVGNGGDKSSGASGAASQGSNGQDSTFGTIVAKGGGGGGGHGTSDEVSGRNGGSGGGRGWPCDDGGVAGTGIQPSQPGDSAGYGNDGSLYGHGGGAGGGGVGGGGSPITILGNNYAGGGKSWDGNSVSCVAGKGGNGSSYPGYGENGQKGIVIVCPLNEGFKAIIDGVEYDNIFVDIFDIPDASTLASRIQSAIRARTGKNEVVYWNTDHLEICSENGRTGSVLKLLPPSNLFDISGAGYLDMGANATEVPGVGEDYCLVRLGLEGKLPRGIIESPQNITTTAKSLNTVYQNKTKTTKLIIVSMALQGASNQTIDIQGLIGSSDNPSIVISHLRDGGSSYTERMTLPLLFIVPAGWYYKIATSGSYSSTPAIDNWFECDFL